MAGNKKQPFRRCIGCGEQKEKRELIRIVRSPENEVRLDPGGRANGRGAYVCNNRECLAKAVKSHALERSLHCGIDPQIYDTLKEGLSENGN